MSKKGNVRIKRFNLAERVAHWSQAFAFVVLFLTGSALIFRGYGALLGAEGLRIAGMIHRIIGVSFPIIILAILLLLTPKTTKEWLRSVFSWNMSDVKFLALFPKEFFGLKVKLPAQGKFNAGEKINSLITIFGSMLMVITGWMLILQDRFSPSVIAWVHLLHASGALLMGAVIIAHAYLALGHPGSREAINGMISGTVSEKFAKEHHELWYNEVKDTNRVVVGEEVQDLKEREA